MKFSCGLTPEGRSQYRDRLEKKYCQPHRWFAWYPVSVESEGHNKTCVWLEFVTRQYQGISRDFYKVLPKYRAIK